jgi:hypothetical protein
MKSKEIEIRNLNKLISELTIIDLRNKKIIVELTKLYTLLGDPAFAGEIRKVRLLIMNENKNPIIEKLIMDFLHLIGECGEMERKNSKKFVKGYF